jgi:hypothetical protein
MVCSLIEPNVFGTVLSCCCRKTSATICRESIEAILLQNQLMSSGRTMGTSSAHGGRNGFWFNPMVRWIGKRLVEERERAATNRCCALSIRRKLTPKQFSTFANCMQKLPDLHVGIAVRIFGTESSKLDHRKPFALSMGRKLALALMSVAAVRSAYGRYGNASAGQPAASSAFTYSSIKCREQQRQPSQH